MAWKPTLSPGVDLRTLPLSPLHGFVLSRCDGASDVKALSQVTGLPVERVEGLLRELVATGALEAGPELHAATTTPPAATSNAHAPPARASHPSTSHASPAHTPGLPDETLGAAPAAPATDTADAPAFEPGADQPAVEASAADASPDDDAPLLDDTPEPADAQSTTTYRERFMAVFKDLPLDARAAAAAQADGADLTALCFDPHPTVVHALLDNPRAGLTHARLAAKHHRTPQGLEALVERPALSSDAGVRRALLQNPSLSSAQYRRLFGGRRMLEHHQVTISREVPEQTRRIARELLRQRFASGPADEKVALLVKTEGRCLTALVGLPPDARTTSLLCGRTYGSSQFIQNLARWSAAPPQLVAHLLRQDAVKRSPQLRMLLERHPNAPHGR